MAEVAQQVVLLEARVASWVSKKTGEDRQATFVKLGHQDNGKDASHKGLRVTEYMCDSAFFRRLDPSWFGQTCSATFEYVDRGRVSYRELVSLDGPVA